MHINERGSFAEILRTADRRQFSVHISKSGITKGNYWHHTKNEKFVVVRGQGVVCFRKIDSGDIAEYYVKNETMQVLDISPVCTHSIVNIGSAYRPSALHVVQ